MPWGRASTRSGRWTGWPRGSARPRGRCGRGGCCGRPARPCPASWERVSRWRARGTSLRPTASCTAAGRPHRDTCSPGAEVSTPPRCRPLHTPARRLRRRPLRRAVGRRHGPAHRRWPPAGGRAHLGVGPVSAPRAGGAGPRVPGRPGRTVRPDRRIRRRPGRALERTVWSESAAAVLCLELERDGLPSTGRRGGAHRRVGRAPPAPTRPTPRASARARRRRAAAPAPAGHGTDLRNPAQVHELLRRRGVDVPNTRTWTLEPYRGTHPLVDALLRLAQGRADRHDVRLRLARQHVGADDRLRGGWTACDGAAGRMTAQNGLHNLPADLRPAICADPGHVFVRADLGQIEPRVLAAVTRRPRRSPGHAAATTSTHRWPRSSGPSGPGEGRRARRDVRPALRGRGRGPQGSSAPTPSRWLYLDRAYARRRGRPAVRTYGGRLDPVRVTLADPLGEAGTGRRRRRRPGRVAGCPRCPRRFARNAIIQGVGGRALQGVGSDRSRPRLRGRGGGQIVLCLHDELLVHVPQQHARHAAADASSDVARRRPARWTGTDRCGSSPTPPWSAGGPRPRAEAR